MGLDLTHHRPAFGTLRRAREFYSAAKVVADASGKRFSHPAHMLASHSVELSLKAFLLTCGTSEDELMTRRVRHNLDTLLDLARAAGLDEVGFDAFLHPTVRAAAAAHGAPYAHRYFVHGTTPVAEIDWLLAAAGVLVSNLHDRCLRDLLGDKVHDAIRPALGRWPSTEEVAALIAKLPKECCALEDVCACIVARIEAVIDDVP